MSDIRFETINGQLCRMVEQPCPHCSHPETIAIPVVEGSAEWALYQMMQGRWVINPSLEQHKTDRNDTRYLHAYGKFGQDIVVKNIITGNDSILGAANIGHWTNYAEPIGWQIYEPEPKESPIDPIERPLRNLILEAKEKGVNIRTWYQDLIFTPESLTSYLNNGKYRWWNIGDWELTKRKANMPMPMPMPVHEPEPEFKVGDWVEFIDADGHKSRGKYLPNAYDNAILVLDTTYNMKCVVPTTKITRKLDPSEVIVRIGCLSGTVSSRDNKSFHLLRKGKNTMVIYFDALDAPTRELVESLLKAQEEKC